MDFSEVLHIIITFFQNNLIITIAVSIVLVFLLFRKPKLFFSLLFLGLLLVGMLYLVLDISSTGKSHKNKLIHQDQYEKIKND
ncbi:MAG: hypothetical protein ACMUJM_14875 [bacterium]